MTTNTYLSSPHASLVGVDEQSSLKRKLMESVEPWTGLPAISITLAGSLWVLATAKTGSQKTPSARSETADIWYQVSLSRPSLTG